jgi:3-phosphoshikimate 1-carboxyvinyltransferase
MAMAFAPLAVKFGEVRIDDPAVVSKSYPEYWTHLKDFGFDLTEV